MQPSHAQLEVGLARSAAEIDAAQALRYTVFYEEMGAHPSREAAASKRDSDSLDAHCDHLVVRDPLIGDPLKAIVGTYRLNRQAVSTATHDFYSSCEFDLGVLAGFTGGLLELGRSCVAPAYRCRSVMQLLWRGVSDYVVRNDIGLMFGCASLPGDDASVHANALSYLYHNHLARSELRVRALPERRVDMARVAADRVDVKAALSALPPLIKGYLRLGAVVGDGAVEDRDFQVTDICIIVETARMAEKYHRRYVESAAAALATA